MSHHTPSDERGFSHVLLLVLFLFVVGLVGFVGWRVATSHYATASAAQTVADVKQAISNSYTVDPESAQSVTENGHVRFLADAVGGTIWKPTGYDFYTTPAQSSNVSVDVKPAADETQTDQAMEQVRTFMKQQILTAGYKALPTTSPAVQFGTPAYSNAVATCVIDDDGVSRIGLSCADFTAFVSSGATLRPLADAYFAKNPDERGSATLTLRSMKDSNTTGYKIAEVGTGNAVGYFFAKDGTWQYMYSAQVPLKCDLSAYPGAEAAYVGQTCIDENGENTVQ